MEMKEFSIPVFGMDEKLQYKALLEKLQEEKNQDKRYLKILKLYNSQLQSVLDTEEIDKLDSSFEPKDFKDIEIELLRGCMNSAACQQIARKLNISTRMFKSLLKKGALSHKQLVLACSALRMMDILS